ncbi:MAG: CASTOR/POLLUX-related putative ion channel [Devosia sp.]
MNVFGWASPRLRGSLGKARGFLPAPRRPREHAPGAGPLLIVGWSELVPALLRQFAGNARPVTMLADRPAAELRDSLALRLAPRLLAQVQLVSGDPGDPAMLAHLDVEAAETILLLRPVARDPLSTQLRTLLALLPLRRGKAGILAEVDGAAASDAVRGLGRGTVQPVRARALAARIAAHAGRLPMLGEVYQTLLGAGLPAISVGDHPSLEGMPFSEATLVFGEAVPLGILDASGRAFLNPSPGTPLGDGLRPILLASGEGDAHVSALPLDIDRAALRAQSTAPRDPERILLLGWSDDVPAIARDLRRAVPPGSVLTVAADVEGLADKVAALPLSDGPLSVEYGRLDPTDRSVVASLSAGGYSRIIVASEEGTADARALATLLALGARPAPGVVALFAEERHEPLVEATGSPAERIYRDRLAALAFAFAARPGPAAAILDDLLDAHGMQIALRDPAELLDPDRPVNFFTVTEACRRRGELAIGHFIHRDPDPDVPPTLVLNPIKARRVSYRAGDRIVVLLQGSV